MTEPKREEATNYLEPFWSSDPVYEYYLEVLWEGSIIEKISLNTKKYYVMGRSPACDIPTDSPSVSRRHAVLQHKDTGELFLYDLGSTHGSFINQKKISELNYTPLHVGDQFKLGVSSKIYIVGGPEEFMREEEEIKIDKKIPQISKEELFRKRVEQVHRIAEEREKNRISYKHSEEGINWGQDSDNEGQKFDNYDSEQSDIEEVEYSLTGVELMKMREWTEKQQSVINKIIDFENKIERMTREKYNLAKKEKTGLDDLSEGQKKRLQAIDLQISKIQQQSLEQRKALKTSLNSQRKKSEKPKSVPSKPFDDFPSDEDEYYDQTTRNRTKVQSRPSVISCETTENYDSLKTKLERLLKQRQIIVDKLLKSSKVFEDTEELDPIDKFMEEAQRNQEEQEKHKLNTELVEVSKEIEKINSLLTLVTPASNKIQKAEISKPFTKEKTQTTSSNKDANICPKIKPRSNPNSITQTMKRIEELQKDKGVVVQSEIEAKDNININPSGDISSEITQKDQSQNASNSEVDNRNYFLEIVKNAGKDEINIKDYKLFEERYSEFGKKGEELKHLREAAANKEKKSGISYLFPVEGKRSIPSEESRDPVPTKIRPEQGPTPKPASRNQFVTEEEEPDYSRFLQEDDLTTVKKPHT